MISHIDDYAAGRYRILHRRSAHQAGMRALTSLMYWAGVEEGAESELRMGDFFSDKAPDRAAEASEGWALKARADALGGAMLEAAYPTGASLPPGLEWTQ